MVGICWYNPGISSTFVDKSWHIGNNVMYFFLDFSAFDLAFCLVLSCTHGSLPALEDKLGCYPCGRCGVVCVYKMLDAVFWIIVKTRF